MADGFPEHRASIADMSTLHVQQNWHNSCCPAISSSFLAVAST
jgi:hypothetical protein